MKVIIQIPCYNEEHTLPAVIEDLPKTLPGVDVIEYLIIDDGSKDRTVEVARQLGVHHIVELGSNRGLAMAFTAGIRACVDLGADIIVNTDGDNQYSATSIGDLIQPVLTGKADVVVGARPIEDIDHFSWLKKRLQKFGSSMVQYFSGTNVADTTSGFRAYTSEAAMRLQVFNRYTYTLETIIQAGALDMRITHVPIKVNAKTRESRLISSIPRYIWRSMSIIVRSYVRYRPLRTFLYLSVLPGAVGLGLCIRFLCYYFSGGGSGHLQSLLLATILLLLSFLLIVMGILGDLIGANQKLIYDVLHLNRKLMADIKRNNKD